jgi:hypothetical protein
MTERAWIMVVVLVLAYLLPTVIAVVRGRRVVRVLVLNVATGWTGWGWLVSMGMALA